MREIMPGAATGSSAACPNTVCPLVTVSRLVPSLSISASNPACEDAERPRTATTAATPMAMPSADSVARSLRVRKPMLDSRARSRTATAPTCGAKVASCLTMHSIGDSAVVGDDASVAHLNLPGHPGRDVSVVRDDHDRGAGRRAVPQAATESLALSWCRGCQSVRRRGRSPAARPVRARSRPAGVGRPRAASVGQSIRSASPTWSSASIACRRRSRSGTPAYNSPSATLSKMVACSARKNCWNTKPILLARSRDNSRSDSFATSMPVMRTVPLVGRSNVPIRCNNVVLPEPDGPTTPTNSPHRH